MDLHPLRQRDVKTLFGGFYEDPSSGVCYFGLRRRVTMDLV